MNNVPAAIEELQLWFAKIVTSPFRKTAAFHLPIYPEPLVKEIREKITAGPHLSAEQRMGLFNQQYWWRLFVLLQESFPTLVRLFGYSDFNTLIAEPYLLSYPPNDWFLPLLGKDLVGWIHEEYKEEDRELIFQVAQLDAAYEELLHEEDSKKIFTFNADIYSFRTKLLEESVAHWQTADLPRLDRGAYSSLLYRTKEKIVHEYIPLS